MHSIKIILTMTFFFNIDIERVFLENNYIQRRTQKWF